MRSSLCLLLVAALACYQPSVDADDLPDNLNDVVLGIRTMGVVEAKPALKKDKIDIPTTLGVILLEVSNYGPAAEAGITPMTVITMVGKQPIKSDAEFKELILKSEPGKPLQVTTQIPTTLQSGRTIWKKGTASVTPVTRKAFLFGCMDIVEDKFKGTAYYRHKDSPKVSSSGDEVFVYAGKANNALALRIKIQFAGDDWLFVEGYTFKIGESTFTIKPATRSAFERDNSAGRVWEWLDIAVDDETMKLVEALSNATSASMRYHGSKYTKDRDIPADELTRLRNTLFVYKILKAENAK